MKNLLVVDSGISGDPLVVKEGVELVGVGEIWRGVNVVLHSLVGVRVVWQPLLLENWLRLEAEGNLVDLPLLGGWTGT